MKALSLGIAMLAFSAAVWISLIAQAPAITP